MKYGINTLVMIGWLTFIRSLRSRRIVILLTFLLLATLRNGRTFRTRRITRVPFSDWLLTATGAASALFLVR